MIQGFEVPRRTQALQALMGAYGVEQLPAPIAEALSRREALSRAMDGLRRNDQRHNIDSIVEADDPVSALHDSVQAMALANGLKSLPTLASAMDDHVARVMNSHIGDVLDAVRRGVKRDIATLAKHAAVLPKGDPLEAAAVVREAAAGTAFIKASEVLDRLQLVTKTMPTMPPFEAGVLNDTQRQVVCLLAIPETTRNHKADGTGDETNANPDHLATNASVKALLEDLRDYSQRSVLTKAARGDYSHVDLSLAADRRDLQVRTDHMVEARMVFVNSPRAMRGWVRGF